MKIKTIEFANNTVFAPLAGIGNLPFRLMAKEGGAGLVFSEMISSNGLIHESPKTIKLLDSSPLEKPLGVQIFGSDPVIMAEAAAMVQESGADMVDINLGCSVKKIIKTGAGAALMRAPRRAETVLRAVRQSIRIPLTIKIRSGWDKSGDQAMEIAKIAENSGVDAVSIHPRTATQGFRGKADWSLIKRIKEAIHIPVIGNGDILCAEDAAAMLETTGCDGVMIGRAVLGNPMIFAQVTALLQSMEPPVYDMKKRFLLMMRYLDSSVQYFGELHACRMMRSRLGWFVKGLPSSSRFRESIKSISTMEEAGKIIQEYRSMLITCPSGGRN